MYVCPVEKFTGNQDNYNIPIPLANKQLINNTGKTGLEASNRDMIIRNKK